MSFKIDCQSLGVEDCDLVVSGETPGEVVRKIVDHLETEHDIDMPDPDLILRAKFVRTAIAEIDPDALIIVKRLREKLNIGTAEDNNNLETAMRSSEETE